MLTSDREINRDFDVNNLFLNLDFQHQEETFEYKWPLLDHPSNYQMIVTKLLTRTSLPYIKLHESKKYIYEGIPAEIGTNDNIKYDYVIKLRYDYKYKGMDDYDTRVICKNLFIENITEKTIDRKCFGNRKDITDEGINEYVEQDEWLKPIQYPFVWFDTGEHRDIYSLDQVYQMINNAFYEIFIQYVNDNKNVEDDFQDTVKVFNSIQPIRIVLENNTPKLYIIEEFLDCLIYGNVDGNREMSLYFSKNLYRFLKGLNVVPCSDFDGEFCKLILSNVYHAEEIKESYILEEFDEDEDDKKEDKNEGNEEKGNEEEDGEEEKKEEGGEEEGGKEEGGMEEEEGGEEEKKDEDADNDEENDEENKDERKTTYYIFTGEKLNIMELSDYIGIAVTSPDFPIKEQIYPQFNYDFEENFFKENRRRYIPYSESCIIDGLFNGNEKLHFEKQCIKDLVKSSTGDKILFVKYFDSKTEDLNAISYENNNSLTTLKMDLMNVMPLKKFTLRLYLIDRYNNFEPLYPKIEGFDDVIKLQLLFTRIKGTDKENRNIIETKMEVPMRYIMGIEEEEDNKCDNEKEEENSEPEIINEPEILPDIKLVPVPAITNKSEIDEILPDINIIPVPSINTEKEQDSDNEDDDIEAPPEKKIYLGNENEDSENENDLY